MPDKYGTGWDAHYCYPGSNVLINKLGIRDAAQLEEAEITLTRARVEQFEPDFDDISFSALRHIHHHLFQDLYAWAGALRVVDISKGNARFANINRIEPEARRLFSQLENEAFLANASQEHFVRGLAGYFSELNVIHPFRDGNGRAQRLLFEVISINAGYALRWGPIGRAEWVEANIAAFQGNLHPLIALFDRAVCKL